jgi:hypothetical protein
MFIEFYHFQTLSSVGATSPRQSGKYAAPTELALCETVSGYKYVAPMALAAAGAAAECFNPQLITRLTFRLPNKNGSLTS